MLLCLILLPLIGAGVSWFIDSSSVSGEKRLVPFFFSLATFILSLVIWFLFDNTSAQMFQMTWSPSAISGHTNSESVLLGIDAISLWMILLTAFLFPICILCSPASLCAVLAILESLLLSCWCIMDLLGFYILFESTLIPMFLLICLGGSRERKVRAAYLLVFYTLIGSLVWLPCVLFIYSEVGTTSLELLYMHKWGFNTQCILWWGFFLALAVKIPVVPVHLWLPEAHVEAPTAGSVLLAGVVLKLGTYGFLRFCLPLLPDACLYYSPLVCTISLIGLIYTSFSTLRQVDLKKVIAYSSIAHMNMANMALFTMHEQSYTGCLFMMISHGIVSPALFLLVGNVYSRYHTKSFRDLTGGFALTMPMWSAFFFVFSMANMALPLSPNFISECALFCGVFSTNTVLAICATFSMILSAAYTLWTYARIVHGLPNLNGTNYASSPGAQAGLHLMGTQEAQSNIHSGDLNKRNLNMTDSNRIEFWCLVPLAVCLLWLGLKPEMLIENISNSVFLLHYLIN
jgi:NADH-quinone oxidoreductase subunit M